MVVSNARPRAAGRLDGGPADEVAIKRQSGMERARGGRAPVTRTATCGWDARARPRGRDRTCATCPGSRAALRPGRLGVEPLSPAARWPHRTRARSAGTTGHRVAKFGDRQAAGGLREDRGSSRLRGPAQARRPHPRLSRRRGRAARSHQPTVGNRPPPPPMRAPRSTNTALIIEDDIALRWNARSGLGGGSE